MLKGILSKEICASCRFCCSFRRRSLWELPLFEDAAIQKLGSLNEYGTVIEFDGRKTPLEARYMTDDPSEEVPCPFLNSSEGCVLNADDKPFDCSIWPLRLMAKGDELVIALTPTCPAVGPTPSPRLISLVNDEGLGERIYEYANSHDYLIKPYVEGFPVLMSRPRQ
ncbi:MAG: hypothetical protein HUJ94_08335 [Bacteroidales bacterium]|nr:hypothetical protein [Bacteroidales bacterium]